ncbi:MAG: T9SS type A sorting domain-containing protein [Bacteroidales bacterium]|nr:T9SS type A sorting domain-containing protein [Bacteroidales bacterium]
MKSFTKILIVLFLAAIATNVMANLTEKLPEKWEEIVKNVINKENPLINSGDKILKTFTEKNGYVVLEVLYMNWEDENWVNDSKHVYTYDENGYMFEFCMQSWTEGIWVDYIKITYTNNSSGKPIESLLYIWNPANELWVLTGKYIFTYDVNEFLIEQLMQVWLEEQWIDSDKWLFTYDGNGNLIEELELDWDYIGEIWENFDIHYYTYVDDLLMEDLKQMWEEGAWVNDINTFWTYDGEGHATERLTKAWPFGATAWENFLHNTFTYNANWQEIEDFVEKWESGVWTNHEIHYKTYDANGMIIEKLVQVFEAKGWVNCEKQLYTNGLVGISEYYLTRNSNLNLISFPNPFSSTTSISFDVFENSPVRLEIFDLMGKLVKTIVNIELSPDSYSFNWDGTNDNNRAVQNGIYFYKLSAGKFTQTKRLTFIK